jgi:hypothetical protein
MAEYISAAQAAKKWGLSNRRTQLLLAQERIPGAVMVGSRWIIPADAEKPTDARMKSAKYIKDTKRPVPKGDAE